MTEEEKEQREATERLESEVHLRLFETWGTVLTLLQYWQKVAVQYERMFGKELVTQMRSTLSYHPAFPGRGDSKLT